MIWNILTEALDKYKEVEKLQIEILRNKHPDTLKTRNNITACINSKCSYDESLFKCMEVEKLQTDILGYKHPDTLTTQNNIASCLDEMRIYNEQ